jgi:hypothetical protein
MCFAEKLGDKVIDPCLGTTFDSIGEAYDFYNLYSWEHGFRISYGKSRLNSEKTKCMQEIVCCSVSIYMDHYELDACFLFRCRICGVYMTISIVQQGKPIGENVLSLRIPCDDSTAEVCR